MNLLVLRFLTMNTEDERRDEAEAINAALEAVRLEGDVITANGSIISGECCSRLAVGTHSSASKDFNSTSESDLGENALPVAIYLRCDSEALHRRRGFSGGK